MLGQVLLSTVSVTKCYLHHCLPGFSCVMTPSIGLYPNMCDNPLHHWLFTLPFTEQFISKFVLYYQKGLILYLSFAEILQ